MAKAEPVTWQPISQMPLIASMIATSLADTQEHLGTLAEAMNRPHVLDDATIDRVEQVHASRGRVAEAAPDRGDGKKNAKAEDGKPDEPGYVAHVALDSATMVWTGGKRCCRRGWR